MIYLIISMKLITLICVILLCLQAIQANSSPQPSVLAQTSSQSPVEASTQQPVEASTQQPVEASTEDQVHASPDAPTSAPVETSTQHPVEASTEAATSAPVEESTQHQVETSTQHQVETSTQHPVEASTEVATSVPVEESTQPPVDASTQPPIEKSPEAATSPQSAVQTSTQPQKVVDNLNEGQAQQEINSASQIGAKSGGLNNIANLVIEEGDVLCKGLNPFLDHLSSKGVTIYEKVQNAPADDTVCKTEWSQYMTCCQGQSLIRYANADKESILGHVAKVNQEYQEFIENIQDIKLRSLQVDYYFKNAVDPEGKKELKNARTLFKKSTQIYFNRFTSRATVESFAQENLKCWNKMIKVRQKSLCATCSSRSSQFFINDRVVVAPRVCINIVTECRESFTNLVNYMKDVENLDKLVIMSEDTNRIIDFSQILAKYKVIMSQSNKNKWWDSMFGQITKSVDLTDDLKAKADSALSRYICSMSLNLVGIPLIETIDNISNSQSVKLPVESRIKKFLATPEHELNAIEIKKVAKNFISEKIGRPIVRVNLPLSLKIKVSINIKRKDEKATNSFKKFQKICKKVNGKIVCWYSEKVKKQENPKFAEAAKDTMKNQIKNLKKEINDSKKTEQAKSDSGSSNYNANKQDVKVVKNVVQQKISTGSSVQVKSTILASHMPVRKLRLITSPTRGLALSGSIESKSSLESVIQSSTATSSRSEHTSAPIQGTSGVLPELELSSQSSTSSDHTLTSLDEMPTSSDHTLTSSHHPLTSLDHPLTSLDEMPTSSDHTLTSPHHPLTSLDHPLTSLDEMPTSSISAVVSSIPEPAANPIQVKPGLPGKPSLTADFASRDAHSCLFTVDTMIMSKSDNMFTSYDGAKGTTLAQLNYHTKPMMFAKNFP
jgi:hypothetical protein